MKTKTHLGIPAGFYEMILQKDKYKMSFDPLFKYAYHGDVLRDFNLNGFIYVRITKSLIEAVFLKGVNEFEINCLAYIFNHIVGQFFVNTPTAIDNTKLTHIGSVRNDTKQKAIFQMMTRNINRQSFPMHFVLNAKFNINSSKLLHKVASNHTIKRLLDVHKDIPFDFGL
jgi:hypothetical protein